MAYVIGVDCGTSGTKTVLFDEKGTVISSVTIEYPMYQPKNGYAEQDPADWANAMINTIKAVMTKSGVNKEDVAGVGISGQMHGLVTLDKDNNVLRKSIIWCDQRTAAEVEEMNEKLGREKLIKITANPALTGWTAAKILWVKNNESDIYEKCRHILLPKDYLRFILTGEYATEVSDASGMQLLDTPGILWPKFEDPDVGLNLAFCGSIKDEILDVSDLALELVKVLEKKYPELLISRYKIEKTGETALETMERIAMRRGFILSGKRIDYERCARTILDEFRAGIIGNITLETADE